MTAPTLAALKKQAKKSGSKTAAAIQQCREVVSDPNEFARSGYQGDKWAFAASSCALAWRLTRDKSFAKAGTKLWRALLEDVDVLGDRKACVPSNPPESWNAAIRRDNGYAIRFIAPHAALAYDWLYDAPGVDEALRRQSRACFGSWIDWYAKAGYLPKMPGANYHAGFVLAKTLTAIAMAGEDRAGDRAFAEVRDDQFGRQIVGQGLAGAGGVAPAAGAGGVAPGVGAGALVGGDWPEGWQYAPLSVVEYALAARAVEEQGVKLPALHRWASELALRAVYAATPAGDETYAGGDTAEPKAHLPQIGAGLLAVIAGPGSDEAAGWAAGLVRWPPPGPESPVFWALAEARGIAPRGYADRPRPLWYLARGTRNLYGRSGWGADAFWTVFTSAPRVVADHQHPDASNFVLSRGHDHLIVDPSPYGARSSLTSNALTCDSPTVPGDYRPSQTPWSRAELPWARATRGGVIAARSDFAGGFRFSQTPSDVAFARRDWAFLPEGEIVAIDRVVTGGPQLRTYLRFRTPAHLAFSPDRRLVQGTVGKSAVAIHPVTLSGGSPAVRSVRVGDCESGAFGACRDARVPVDEYALELPGPTAIAVHVIDGLRHDEAPAAVAPVGENLLGASVARAGRRSFVVATGRTEAGAADSMSYTTPGAEPARHVVFDAPEDGAGRAAVMAVAKGDRCVIDIKPAAPGGGFVGRPLVFTTTTAASGCKVVEDPDAPPATIR